MSNYVKSTNFASKDTLPSGDSNKIVKGTEIDTEFNNIATAISTKADLSGPTFTGSPVLPTGTTGVTQSSSDDSTKLATTAFVQDVADLIKSALYPVGSIYCNATSSTNPATLLGFGTWTAFGSGRVMVGDGGGFTAGNTGGSADSTVVSHSHTATSSVSDPGHAHYADLNAGGTNTFYVAGQAGSTASQLLTKSATTGVTVSTSISTEGSSGTNANLQPYIVVYMWKRTA